MPVQVPLGIDDFRKLRELGLTYVDKTSLIRQLIDRPGIEVALLPRPRRFGKTLNLSMLRCFFEKQDEDLSRLFEGLSIWAAGEPYRRHFQRYPVIHLTLKDIKYESFERCWSGIREKIEDLFDQNRSLLEGGVLSEMEARRYRQVLDGTAEATLYDRALYDLSRYLHRRHGERVVILIDEYDTPVHAGYLNGYAREVLEFYRAFLTAGLKGNPHLHRAVLTGIFRVARESIFSGLNNVAVYSLLEPEFGTAFGFTEAEVEGLLAQAGRSAELSTVRDWYNGYDFGGNVIYNPWSVLNFLAREDPAPRAYWLGTSSNDLIKEMLVRWAPQIGATFESLLEGGSIEHDVEENLVLSELSQREDALWSLLVFSGYSKAEQRSRGPDMPPIYRLSIPNREVRTIYAETFRGWLKTGLEGKGGSLKALTAALLAGDAPALERELQVLAESVLSYHDAGGRTAEQLYHGFVLGLAATLEPEYKVRSNRESGRGRPDVLIQPADTGKAGVVLELKVARAGRKTLEQALEERLSQIRDNDYGAELRAAGACAVHALVVAFDGKSVGVRAA